MKTKTRSIHQIIEEQVQKWRIINQKERMDAEKTSIVTISREPGTGGNFVAEALSERLGFDLFYQAVINEMAESAQVSVRLIETLDEKGVSVLEDWISSLVDKRHLWPDRYLQHLMKAVGTIGKHGQAVIVGRGGNFVLPPDKRLSVRLVAPLEIRVKNVARHYNIVPEEARSRVIRTDSDRRAFVRKYFNADIGAPLNYDLVINTGIMSIDSSVDAIIGALKNK
jgi:cytidylate kinase